MASSKAAADKLFHKGFDFYQNAEWKPALECWLKAKETYEKLGDAQSVALIYNKLGIVNRRMGEWLKAIEFYQKSLKIKEKLGDAKGAAQTYNNLGVVYRGMGEWLKAIEFYQKSLETKEKLGDAHGAAHTYNNIGIVYRRMGEWLKAIEFYQKSLEIKERLGDAHGAAQTYNNLGIVYADMGEWPKSIEFYQKSLETKEKLGDKESISETLKNLGEINIKNGNWDEARAFLEKSLDMAKELAPISTVEILANRGELSGLEDKYDDAIGDLNKALEIGKTAGAKPVEIDILQKLADVHLSRYREDLEIKGISSTRKFFDQSLGLARSMNMRMQEGIAMRGMGIVQAIERDIPGSRNSFIKSIELFNQLGALFELDKTYLEYARMLYENGFIMEAEITAKSTAFDSKRNNFRELLIKAYILLGDISMKNTNQYNYYLEALEVSEFNPKIFVRTCYHLVFRMKKMEMQILRKFIGSLKNKIKDPVFSRFLDILDAKIQGKDYDITELPAALAQEIESFNAG